MPIFLLAPPAMIIHQEKTGIDEKAKSVVRQIEDLEKVIGAYPPNINSKEEHEAIKAKYDKALKDVNELMQSHPKELRFLFQRAYLQSMGHNMNEVGAFERSAKDFEELLQKNPKSVSGHIEFGMLLVNADPKFAQKAETLFRRAQQLAGNKLIEDAQRGIFFALYYQAKMKAALVQADLLIQNWPGVEQYAKLRQITSDALARAEKNEEGK